MKERGEPSEEDYVTLKPGESVKGSFDLSDAYDWKDLNGLYTIWYDGVAPSPPVQFKLK